MSIGRITANDQIKNQGGRRFDILQHGLGMWSGILITSEDYGFTFKAIEGVPHIIKKDDIIFVPTSQIQFLKLVGGRR